MSTLPVHLLREARCLHCISLAILSLLPSYLDSSRTIHARYYGYPLFSAIPRFSTFFRIFFLLLELS